MQCAGYLVINNEKILVLVRQKKYTRAFKVRKSGKDGIHFTDEEFTFSREPDSLTRLKSGEVFEV